MRILLFTCFILFLFLSHAQQEVGVLDLRECIDIAVENNLNVQRSKLNVEGAASNLQQAQGQRYPSLNLAGNYGFNWGRGIDPTSNLFVAQRVGFNGVNGRLGLPLVNGMQVTNSIKQRKIEMEASKFDLARTKNDIILSVALTYLNVILNKELKENAQLQLSSSQQQLDQTKKLVESGALPISNELQLVSQVATNEVNLINAENNLDLALLSLKQSLLLPSSDEIDIEVPALDMNDMLIESLSIQDIYNMALNTQPEIQSADLRVESAVVALDVSKGGLYPSLNLGFNFSTNFSDALKDINVIDMTLTDQSPTRFITATGTPIFQQNFDFELEETTRSLSTQYSDNFSRSLTFSLNIPIFNGFNEHSTVQRSKIAVKQAELNATQERNQLYQNIETAYRNALAAKKTFYASEKQVEALEETFRTVESQYNIGAINFIDYQVATNNLMQAQTDLSRAKYDFIFRLKVLDFYQGKPLNF